MSTSSQKDTTTQQSSQTSPWAPAQSDLSGILGSVGNLLPQAGLSDTERNAISGLLGNSGFLSQFTPRATSITTDLLNGGNANAQAPMINSAYQQYQAALAPLTNPASLNPMTTPGFSDALRTVNSDITNQINGQFAAAGRDMSGMNTQSLARGLSQGEGGLIANQYNQNVQNLTGAAGGLYGAGNTTGGILAALNQQGITNEQTGLGTAGVAQKFALDPYNQQLAAMAAQFGIPLQNLQGLAGITGGIASLGNQSTGTKNEQATSTPGLLDYAHALVPGGVPSLWPASKSKSGNS